MNRTGDSAKEFGLYVSECCGVEMPFGEGDTPMKEVLQLLKKEKYGFPGNIELEYRIPEDSNLLAEMKKCLAYCKDCLA